METTHTLCEKCKSSGWYAIDLGPDGYDIVCPCDYCDGTGIRKIEKDEVARINALAVIREKGYTIGKDINVLLDKFSEHADVIKSIHPNRQLSDKFVF